MFFRGFFIMKKIVISLDAGFCGTDLKEGWEVPDDISEDELNDLCWQRAKDHAEMYGIYPRCEYEDCEDISDEELDSDDYSDNIEGSWEPYDPEKHDSYLTYGSNDRPQFNQH